jgi:hypothetical protein
MQQTEQPNCLLPKAEEKMEQNYKENKLYTACHRPGVGK